MFQNCPACLLPLPSGLNSQSLMSSGFCVGWNQWDGSSVGFVMSISRRRGWSVFDDLPHVSGSWTGSRSSPHDLCPGQQEPAPTQWQRAESSQEIQQERPAHVPDSVPAKPVMQPVPALPWEGAPRVWKGSLRGHSGSNQHTRRIHL